MSKVNILSIPFTFIARRGERPCAFLPEPDNRAPSAPIPAESRALSGSTWNKRFATLIGLAASKEAKPESLVVLRPGGHGPEFYKVFQLRLLSSLHPGSARRLRFSPGRSADDAAGPNQEGYGCLG
jgi:hypothetical protein